MRPDLHWDPDVLDRAAVRLRELAGTLRDDARTATDGDHGGAASAGDPAGVASAGELAGVASVDEPTGVASVDEPTGVASVDEHRGAVRRIADELDSLAGSAARSAAAARDVDEVTALAFRATVHRGAGDPV